MTFPCYLLFGAWLSACVGNGDQFQSQWQQASGLDLNQYTIGTREERSNYVERGTEQEAEEQRKKERAKEDLRRLSRDFSSIPSANDLNNYLDNSLNSPTDDCDQSVDRSTNKPAVKLQNRPGTNPAAFGARKVLATFFQSCKALDIAIDPSISNLKGVRKVGNKRQVYDIKSYVNSHAILSELKSDPNYPAKGCLDATKRPPVYGYGSQKYPDQNGEINLFTAGAGVSRSSKPVSAIDCSSFISVALASQGLKVRTTDTSFTGLTTATYDQILDKPNSCMKNVKYSMDRTLGVGDLINVANDHIIMIDEVSDDPLGIKKHVKNKSCDRLSINDFDFTYIHSGAVNNSYGPSRVHSSEHSGGTMFNNLRISAVGMCKKLLKNPKHQGVSTEVNHNRRFSISYHNSSDAKCIDNNPVSLKNEECVEQCLQEEGWN